MSSIHEKSDVFIVGGGVAGVAAAYKLVKRAQESGSAIPEITIIDRNQDVAQGSSQAYGGLLTANSYLTVDFANPVEAETKLLMRYVADAQKVAGVVSGWALHATTEAEKRWIEEVNKSASRDPETRKAQEITYHRFGLSSIRGWEDFCAQNPDFANACSFRYSSGKDQSGILKIYADNTDAKFAKDRDFLSLVKGDAENCRQLTSEEARIYCPAAVDAYGEDALYCAQHGGNINGQAFCSKMIEHLRQQGVTVNFLGGQELDGIEYGGNSGDITRISIKGADGSTRNLGTLDDHYIFATGADQGIWSKLGYKSSPIMGVGGTTLTVPVTDEVLYIPLKFVDKHGGPVMIPIKDARGNQCIRIGGYTVFSGENSVNTQEQFAVDFLTRQYESLERLYPAQAHAFLREQLEGNLTNLAAYPGSWAGVRPVTPDNHAIVDRVPGTRNGVVIAGLGAMGALSMGTAEMATQLVAGVERDSLDIGNLSSQDADALRKMTEISRFEKFRTSLQRPTVTIQPPISSPTPASPPTRNIEH